MNMKDVEAKSGNYETSNFHISGGKSLENFKILKKNKVNEQTIKEYLIMEDEFLEMERETVCKKLNKLILAMKLSQEIKEKFRFLDFKYHDLHIQQMSMPSKFINKNLSC